MVEGDKEERRLYAAIYKRDYYVNNVEGKELCSSGDEDDATQKKVKHVMMSSISPCFYLLIKWYHLNLTFHIVFLKCL